MTSKQVHEQPLLEYCHNKAEVVKLINALEFIAVSIREFNDRQTSHCIDVANVNKPKQSKTGSRKQDQHANTVPITERHLLNFREAAMLLSMSEASLRDLVHKGQGPENVRRGKRVCFTQEGLKKYVDGLPREYPYQDIIEAINANGSRPATIEEQRAFGV